MICEKPLVGSLAEADALAELVRECKSTLMPVFQARFGNGLAKAQHLLTTGAAGRVYLATPRRTGRAGPTITPYPGAASSPANSAAPSPATRFTSTTC